MSRLSRVLAVLILGSLTVAVTAARQSPAPEDWKTLTSRLEAAALADNTAMIKDARVSCLRLLAASPAPAPARVPLIRYTIAYADWRLVTEPALSAKEQSDLIDDAEVQLTEAIRLDGAFAEAMGLLSNLYGVKISKNPDLGMTLGIQSNELLDRAVRLEPANARLLVLRGISQFYTPPEYGGSVKDAEATLRRALLLLEAEPATKPWPNWGRFDAHVFLGQALASHGDKTGAKAEYEKALAIAPESSYVRNTLLPPVIR